MNRQQWDIYADILKVAQNGAGKTHIMYQCNLSHRTLKYLAALVEAQLLTKASPFTTTEKESRFLERYGSLKRLLEV